MGELILALDFGGTKHTAGVTARGGRAWHARRQITSPPAADATTAAVAAQKYIDALKNEPAASRA